MNTRAAALVCATGAWALSTQTLLFRAFFTFFDGHALGLGAFYASWLFWVGCGALAARSTGDRVKAEGTPGALWWWPPVCLAQWALLEPVRVWVGEAAHTVLPLSALLTATMALNAPCSFMTGWIFVRLCSMWRMPRGNNVAAVYAWEALGSALGGAGVTALLGVRWPGIWVLWLTATALYGAGALAASSRRPLFTWAPLIVLLLLAACAMPQTWARWQARQVWARWLPAGAYVGSFQTAHGEYHFGQYGEQFVVMEQHALATVLPMPDTDLTLAALMVQAPGARRVWIYGEEGYALALRLLTYPELERVVWLTPDPRYARELSAIVPEAWRCADPRLVMPGREVQAWLRAPDNECASPDLIIGVLPGSSTLAGNRFVTDSFISLLRARLAPDGVLALRATGPVHFLSTEMAASGLTIRATLAASFSHVSLIPGPTTWFLASDKSLVVAKAEVEERWLTSGPNWEEAPAAAVAALYSESRKIFQEQGYATLEAASGSANWVNTSVQPRALLYNLFILLRTLWPAHDLGKRLWWLGRRLPLFWCGFLLLSALLMAARQAYGRRTPGGFGSGLGSLTVASAGAAGLALQIILLADFQMRYGSLWLYIGLVNSLFMVGLFLGARVGERYLNQGHTPVVWLLKALSGLACLTILSGRLCSGWPLPAFLPFFLLTGVACGGPVPAVTHAQARAGHTPARIGALVTSADHFGGALGGLLAGLIFLPLLGPRATLLAGAGALFMHGPWLAAAAGARRSANWAWLPLLLVCAGLHLSPALLPPNWPSVIAPSSLGPTLAFTAQAENGQAAIRELPLPMIKPLPETESPLPYATREVNMPALRRAIEAGELSSHEAQFYHRIE